MTLEKKTYGQKSNRLLMVFTTQQPIGNFRKLEPDKFLKITYFLNRGLCSLKRYIYHLYIRTRVSIRFFHTLRVEEIV